MSPSWPGVIRAYRDRVHVTGEPITLLEGGTPLIPIPRVAEWACPGAELYSKFEGLNPTGSFKDRGMTAAVTEAVAQGAKSIICASTGNTAASAAAYAAHAGIRCVVVVPDGKIAMGKLAGALAYGAQVVQIRGSFDDGLRMVRELSDQSPIALVNSVNPARLQGQKTGSFEICDVLGCAPDIHCLPVGNAGNITAYWLGYREYHADQVIDRLPHIVGGQADGSAPILERRVIDQPETIATAIRIGNPARWCEALTALRESDGQIWRVTDDGILDAQRMLATLDGVFCEPSSATGLAALRRSVQHGKIEVEGKKIVCVLTGHGLKDTEIVVKSAPAPTCIDANLDDLKRLLNVN